MAAGIPPYGFQGPGFAPMDVDDMGLIDELIERHRFVIGYLLDKNDFDTIIRGFEADVHQHPRKDKLERKYPNNQLPYLTLLKLAGQNIRAIDYVLTFNTGDLVYLRSIKTLIDMALDDRENDLQYLEKSADFLERIESKEVMEEAREYIDQARFFEPESAQKRVAKDKDRRPVGDEPDGKRHKGEGHE
jgi:hypothetical protein